MASSVTKRPIHMKFYSLRNKCFDSKCWSGLLPATKGRLCSGMKTHMMSSDEHLMAHVHSRYLFSSGSCQTECGTSSSPAEIDVHTTNQHSATAALKLW